MDTSTVPKVTDQEVAEAITRLRAASFDPKEASRGQISAVLGVSDRRARTIRDWIRYRTVAPSATHAPAPAVVDNLKPIDEHRLKRENADLRHRLDEALRREVLDQDYQHFVSEVSKHSSARPPEWALTPRSGTAHQAVPVAHLSDAHFDEVVDPAQINWVNAYSRDIAESRLQRFFEKTIVLCDEYLKGVNYPGIVVPVSGDMFSGNIHDELRETNFDALCASFRHWIDPMYAGLEMLADRFGKVYVPWVVGNHPRQTKKPRAKGRVRDNFDWLLGSMLQRDFARVKDGRVQLHVSDSADFNFRIFSTRYHQTHGDQFRGGSGIAAELSPMMIGDARKRQRQQAVKMPYDIMILGHWHNRVCLPTIKLNGSIKGYDEYAHVSNFKFQPPMQSFWLDTPERGITFEAPIHVASEDEGWQKAGDLGVFFEGAA